MKMRVFAELRHGSYDGNLNLSESGRVELRKSGGELIGRLAGVSPVILSSTSPRALQSAIFLAEIFGKGAVVLECDSLWDDNSHPGNMEDSIRRIAELAEKAEAVIVVSHLDFVGSIFRGFAREYLHVKLPDQGECHYGEGFLFTVPPGKESVRI